MQSDPVPSRQGPNSSWLRDSAPQPLVTVPPSSRMPSEPPPGARTIIPLRPADDGAGMATAAFVLGIATVFLAVAGVCDLPFGITGFVLGLLGLRSIRRHQLAVGGVALSAIGLVLALGATAVYLYLSGAFH